MGGGGVRKGGRKMDGIEEEEGDILCILSEPDSGKVTPTELADDGVAVV